MSADRVAALTAALLCCAGPALAQAWSEYAFPQSSVAVQLPAAPAATPGMMMVGDLSVPDVVFDLQDHGDDFSLMVADFSGHGGDQAKAVRQIVSDLHAMGDIKLDVQECISGEPGREFSVLAKDGGRADVSLFTVGPRLYLLKAMVPAATAAADSGAAARFQQSMRFAGGRLGPQGPPQPACRGRAREASEITP